MRGVPRAHLKSNDPGLARGHRPLSGHGTLLPPSQPPPGDRSEPPGSALRTAPMLALSDEDVWLTEPELRELLRFSRSTLTRFRARGLPHVGEGRLRRYHLATVLDWVGVYPRRSERA